MLVPPRVSITPKMTRGLRATTGPGVSSRRNPAITRPRMLALARAATNCQLESRSTHRLKSVITLAKRVSNASSSCTCRCSKCLPTNIALPDPAQVFCARCSSRSDVRLPTSLAGPETQLPRLVRRGGPFEIRQMSTSPGRTPPGHCPRRPGARPRTVNRALYAPRVFGNYRSTWGGWAAPFRLKRS